MAKDSRFKYQYRKSASKLHKTVGDILRNHPSFRLHTSFQEYPVNKVNPSYPDGSHHFDWVVPTLKLVIECHGKQHYEAVAFSGDIEQSIMDFHGTQLRDKKKKRAALEAGWTYIIVPYDLQSKVTGEWILEQFTRNHNDGNILKARESKAKLKNKELQRQRRKEYLSSDQHKQKLKAAREARREQYRRLKELKHES